MVRDPSAATPVAPSAARTFVFVTSRAAGSPASE